jgi:hypothetical protein
LFLVLGLMDSRYHDLGDHFRISDLEEGMLMIRKFFTLGTEVEVFAD